MYFHPKDTSELMQYYFSRNNESANLAYGIHYAALLNKISRGIEYDKSTFSYTVDASNRKNIARTLENLTEVLVESKRNYTPAILRAYSTSKMLIGMGIQHVTDTPISIHHIYGVPYIPSSSMKGLVRNWAYQAYFNGQDPFHLKKPIHPDSLNETQRFAYNVVIDLFGTQEQAGKALFYDVFPNESYTIEKDVLAPHYGSYYGEKSMASDSDRVIPIGNLKALVSSTYDIRFAVKKVPMQGGHYSSTSGCSSDELLDILCNWTEKMLIEHGIGAKTSSGYGQFTKVENITHEQLELAEERVKKVKETRKHLQKTRKEKYERFVQKQAEEKEQAKLTEEREAFLQSLSPAERLVTEIQTLEATNAQHVEQSKSTLYQQVIALAEEGQKEPAKALFELWRKADLIKVNKKSKQFEKVSKLKNLIEN